MASGGQPAGTASCGQQAMDSDQAPSEQAMATSSQGPRPAPFE